MDISERIQSAFECHRSGNLERAKYLYQKILRKQPNNPDVLNMLGELFCRLANYDSAIKCIKKALQFRPTDCASAHYNLGYALREKGQVDEAIANYLKAVELKPSWAEAYCNMGLALREKGQVDEAIAHYLKAIELKPSYAEAYCNLGYALREKGQVDEAIANCLKAIELKPSCAEAYCNMGLALQDKCQLDRAITCYQKALQLNPIFAKAYSNLAGALHEKGKYDEALVFFYKAIQLNPNLADTYCNLGITFTKKCQYDEAFKSYEKALQINPNHVAARWNLSLILLLLGNFERGWQEYEWRWKKKEMIAFERNFVQPLWDGSAIKGLTILLHAEQGLGDTIQFIRYVTLVKERGARVIVECQKELKSLFENMEGIQEVVIRGEDLPAFDTHCPLLRLPLVFNTTLDSIPAKIPYITVDDATIQKWKSKFHYNDTKLKVGLVWSGNPKLKGDSNRSMSLTAFKPLAKLNNINFYSLQKGEAAQQARDSTEVIHLIDYTEEIGDFSDTAALIENLDLVISVDTSVAHLGGALGKSVWTLLPCEPDWRWMLKREDSPWYPTMRLFRQPSPGDWESVIAKVKDELMKLSDNN
jgi:tetratricopeptide (TPR) repeat protein